MSWHIHTAIYSSTSTTLRTVNDFHHEDEDRNGLIFIHVTLRMRVWQ